MMMIYLFIFIDIILVRLCWSNNIYFTSNVTYAEIEEIVLLSCNATNDRYLTLLHPSPTGTSCLTCHCTDLGSCLPPSVTNSICKTTVTLASTCYISNGYLSVNVFLNNTQLFGQWTCANHFNLNNTAFINMIQFRKSLFFH